MARFPKPVEGSWTEHYPELGTGLVSYEDSISREHYELEREAIFRRAWLHVGRVEQLPRAASHFTKELVVADTSVTVVRDADGTVRAFHAVGSQPVECDVWAGFIFVNLAPQPSQSLREFLGPMVTQIEDDYPFDELTARYSYRSEVNSNWKIFLDAFQEFYHAPILHGGQSSSAVTAEARAQGYEATHYQLDGPHRMLTGAGILPWELPAESLRPTEQLTRSGLFGPWDAPRVEPVTSTLNPSGLSWGESSYQIFPNFVILVWDIGWYHTYQYWPTAHNRMVFESSFCFRPATTATERVAQEMAAATTKEFALQDANTLEATQTMLESRVVDRFPLGDQELLCRHFHHAVNEWVDAYRRVDEQVMA